MKDCYICKMAELNTILHLLTQMKPGLVEKFHISSLGLFGSIVRDDFSEKSDIDIIVEFSKPIGIEFVDLADLIELKLKKPIDLVSKTGVKPNYFREIEAEIIYV